MGENMQRFKFFHKRFYKLDTSTFVSVQAQPNKRTWEKTGKQLFAIRGRIVFFFHLAHFV